VIRETPLYYKFADQISVTTHLHYMMNRYFSKKALTLIVFLFSITLFSPAYAFEGDAANGKKLFKQNCAACHKLDKKAIGPALAGVTERREEEWLLKWIKNNAELRASGDADAIAIFEEYNGSIMTAFPSLSDQDIYDILQYTIEGDQKVVPPGGGQQVATAPVAEEKDYLVPMMIVLGLLFLLLLALLVKMKNTLRIVQGRDPESIGDEIGAFGKALIANKFIMTVGTIGVGIFFMSVVYWWLMGIGVEQEYQPTQPIAFSHAVHAGANKIDCNYCHSSARHSKHSGIPSANVCMNCHKYIDGSEIVNEATGELKYGGERSPEIAKIYAAIGWNPDEVAYIEDYEQKPIEWIRIHNLPDLAYFNHAQHVSAGQVECQTCHGPIEEMEEVYQYSPLTMGWCIDCHRETKVKTANGYYEGNAEKIMERYHTEDITVDKIGGIECGKCHY
jgi:mono/diheme cytochrome c family protein